ncbi:MAG: hypothetical protein P4M11_04510 [Candidatus Pacebacteria bacterium]|nr:hypothetical protein [Candidatus Paceibacterota bacterium]
MAKISYEADEDKRQELESLQELYHEEEVPWDGGLIGRDFVQETEQSFRDPGRIKRRGGWRLV